MASLDNGMSMPDVDSYCQMIVKGAILTLAVWVDAITRAGRRYGRAWGWFAKFSSRGWWYSQLPRLVPASTMGSKRGKVREKYKRPRPIIMIPSDRSLSALGLAAGMSVFSFFAHASPPAHLNLVAGRLYSNL